MRVSYVHIPVSRDGEVMRATELSDLRSSAYTLFSDERKLGLHLELEDCVPMCISHIEVSP